MAVISRPVAVSLPTMNEWQTLLAQAVQDPNELLQLLALDAKAHPDLHAATAQFRPPVTFTVDAANSQLTVGHYTGALRAVALKPGQTHSCFNRDVLKYTDTYLGASLLPGLVA